MSKQDSLILKGLAILFMLWLHLFDKSTFPAMQLCQHSIFVWGIPLSCVLARATNPVSFFLIISGYGLYISCKNRPEGYNIFVKIKKLYVHYWISLAVFVPIGAIYIGGKYADILHYGLENLIGWNTSWNSEVWFLFPFVINMLMAKHIFKIIDKVGPWLSFSVTFLISMMVGFLISRYSAFLYDNRLLYMSILVLSFLYPFTIGVIFAKYKVLDLIKINSKVAFLLLVLLVIMRCCIATSAVHTTYIALFIALFIKTKRCKTIDNVLTEFGKRSTSMWFVHSYFCYHIFSYFIFGFKYPVLIYLVLVVISYISAIILDYINKKVQRFIF